MSAFDPKESLLGKVDVFFGVLMPWQLSCIDCKGRGHFASGVSTGVEDVRWLPIVEL